MRALAVIEARLYLRDPMALPFALALPLVLLLVFGLPEDSSRPSEDFGGQVPLDTVLPSLVLSLSFAMLGAFRESLEAAWTGSAPEPLALGVMAALTLAAGGAAARIFRWE
jgi:hypothetical protein